jgi:thioredoxin-dependent peroxiredoxin
MIRVGDTAPDFELPDQQRQTVKLSDLRGRPVVVYFYPKADTPGCTVQACGVRDRRADYDAAGATVLGISPDPVKRVRKFDDKYDLGFTLLADEDHAVAEAYGTWVEKKLYGRRYMGVARTTFVVDAEGRISSILESVKPKTHDDDVLAALGAASSGR